MSLYRSVKAALCPLPFQRVFYTWETASDNLITDLDTLLILCCYEVVFHNINDVIYTKYFEYHD